MNHYQERMFYECYNDFSIRLVPKLDAIDSGWQAFSLRSVFDGIPRIVQQLANNDYVDNWWCSFLVLAFAFAIVKINRVKILYPLQAFFVSFLKGTPDFSATHVDLLRNPLALKALNQQWGTGFNINAIPAAAFAIVAFAFNEGSLC